MSRTADARLRQKTGAGCHAGRVCGRAVGTTSDPLRYRRSENFRTLGSRRAVPLSGATTGTWERVDSAGAWTCCPRRPYGRPSNTRLNGVSVARRNDEKPAALATSLNLLSPAWAPSPAPTS